MQHSGRRCFFAFVALASTYMILAHVVTALVSRGRRDPLFALENRAWVASSNNPIDRALCYWIGLCGGFHFLAGSGSQVSPPSGESVIFAEDQKSGDLNDEEPPTWSNEERALREIPQYVLDYAPYVHLSSEERYWPGDLAEHLRHTTQSLNFTGIPGEPRDISNLDLLNAEDSVGSGRHVYLQSRDDVEGHPQWLEGRHSIPSAFPFAQGPKAQPAPINRLTRWPSHRDLRRRQQPSKRGHSNAPAHLIVVPKEDGIVDAIWFFFYHFNRAPKFLGIQFGNHIGDWEHTAIRFQHGIPTEVAFSEHNFGAAYTYDALEKYLIDEDTGDIVGTLHNDTLLPEAVRPVLFSATGSHAMYPRPGTHPYGLPFGLLRDDTDRGPLWDPTLNMHAYTYHSDDRLRASTLTPHSPTGWFGFNGRWGDKYYLLSDWRQYRFAGQYHYLSGPYGPKYKNLMRKTVCQHAVRNCVVKDRVDGR